MKKLIIFRITFILTFYSSLFFLFSCSKGNDDPTPQPPIAIIPELNIQDVSEARTTTGATMRFYVYSNKATTNTVSADYSFVSGSAISPRDYEITSGTVSIPANETQATIDVQIKGDPTNLRQANLQFTILLTNPKLCTLGTTSAIGTIITENGTFLPTDNSGYTAPTTYSGYTLAWSDEFSSENLDSNVWNQEVGNNNGWGNNELEYYTNNLKNTFLSNGNLIIEARKETSNGFNYTSGRMTTQDKKQFKYGRIDIRAKLPVGKGIWPALWMLGSNISTVGWPACGEIDIMELIGTYPNRVSGTIHWKTTAGAATHQGADYYLNSGDFSQQFHVFSIVWQQDSIQWYVDGNLFLTKTVADLGGANNPFNADQFFIFNVAVGGNWPGSPDSTTTFPQRMFVDYVRVYQ
ncbi:MAG: glycoside hydrolase [Bacteroidetes bacterium HGW-Bacteroidetes-3]|jgi:beta-glucanase (GH16 family)|nr:MAG: glycoside hydrolase [Bacteroidetes bacterium HGW-Bacteroidetes-3]